MFTWNNSNCFDKDFTVFSKLSLCKISSCNWAFNVWIVISAVELVSQPPDIPCWGSVFSFFKKEETMWSIAFIHSSLSSLVEVTASRCNHFVLQTKMYFLFVSNWVKWKADSFNFESEWIPTTLRFNGIFPLNSYDFDLEEDLFFEYNRLSAVRCKYLSFDNVNSGILFTCKVPWGLIFKIGPSFTKSCPGTHNFSCNCQVRINLLEVHPLPFQVLEVSLFFPSNFSTQSFFHLCFALIEEFCDLFYLL